MASDDCSTRERLQGMTKTDEKRALPYYTCRTQNLRHHCEADEEYGKSVEDSNGQFR